jgi:hypothetical protein
LVYSSHGASRKCVFKAHNFSFTFRHLFDATEGLRGDHPVAGPDGLSGIGLQASLDQVVISLGDAGGAQDLLAQAQCLPGFRVRLGMLGVDEQAALGAQLFYGEIGEDHIAPAVDHQAVHQGKFAMQFQGQDWARVFRPSMVLTSP